MAGQPTREQIIQNCQLKMIAALEGRADIQEVCGLSIESHWTALIDERTRLLKHYGYKIMGDSPKPYEQRLTNQ